MRFYKEWLARKEGFTLIELMMVVAIMGVLATIIIGSVNGAKASARDIRRVSDIKAIQTALTQYYNDNNHYPCQIYANGVSTNYTTPGGVCYPGFYQSIYMASTPFDPRDNTTRYAYSALNSNNSTNCLSSNTYIASYHLGAVLENTNTNLLSTDKDETDIDELTKYKACSESTNPPFNGNMVNAQGTQCSGSSASVPLPDLCYDVTPD